MVCTADVAICAYVNKLLISVERWPLSASTAAVCLSVCWWLYGSLSTCQSSNNTVGGDETDSACGLLVVCRTHLLTHSGCDDMRQWPVDISSLSHC